MKYPDVHAALRPLRPLTPQERAVLRWVLRGYRQKEVAERMGLSVSTVDTHCRHIDQKIPGNKPRYLRWGLWAAGCPLDLLTISDT